MRERLISMAEKGRVQTALAKAIKKQRKLKAGDKVTRPRTARPSSLAVLGTDPLEDGFNILGAHIDRRVSTPSKPALRRTPISRYLTRILRWHQEVPVGHAPLAIHGVIAPKAGRSIPRFVWARIRPTP